MERLSNEEFENCIIRMKAAGIFPPNVDTEDRANLQLASRFLFYRNKAPLEIIGTSSESEEVMEIMLALDRLRPIEKKIIYAYLISGYPINVVANLTFRSPHHCINSLRAGLTSLRKMMDFDKSHSQVKRSDYSPIF